MKFNLPEEVLKICRILREANYKAFVVGGCLRDLVLGLIPKDYDIATNCLPGEISSIFKRKGYKVVSVDKKHRTASVIIDNTSYEITSFKEKGLFRDMARRDFTFNAMAYEPKSGTFIDYFNGIKDIKNKRIRCVGNPKDRFGEDYLRMLRAVRYAATLDYKIEISAFKVIKALRGKIRYVAAERILGELNKMAEREGRVFARGLGLLKESGLLRVILPEVDRMDRFEHGDDQHPEGNVWQHTLAALNTNEKKDATLNYAILFHDVGKTETCRREGDKIRYIGHEKAGAEIIDRIAGRLRMSNALRDNLRFVVCNHMRFHAIPEMSLYKIVQLITDDRWNLLYQTCHADAASRMHIFDEEEWQKIERRVKSVEAEYKEQKKLESIRSIVNGELIMDVKNISPGPKVGEYIDKTVRWIIDNSIDIGDTGRIKGYIEDLA